MIAFRKQLFVIALCTLSAESARTKAIDKSAGTIKTIEKHVAMIGACTTVDADKTAGRPKSAKIGTCTLPRVQKQQCNGKEWMPIPGEQAACDGADFRSPSSTPCGEGGKGVKRYKQVGDCQDVTRGMFVRCECKGGKCEWQSAGPEWCSDRQKTSLDLTVTIDDDLIGYDKDRPKTFFSTDDEDNDDDAVADNEWELEVDDPAGAGASQLELSDEVAEEIAAEHADPNIPFPQPKGGKPKGGSSHLGLSEAAEGDDDEDDDSPEAEKGTGDSDDSDSAPEGGNSQLELSDEVADQARKGDDAEPHGAGAGGDVEPGGGR